MGVLIRTLMFASGRMEELSQNYLLGLKYEDEKRQIASVFLESEVRSYCRTYLKTCKKEDSAMSN